MSPRLGKAKMIAGIGFCQVSRFIHGGNIRPRTSPCLAAAGDRGFS